MVARRSLALEGDTGDERGEAWPPPSLASCLRNLNDGLDAGGARATVLYSGPTAVAGLFSLPRSLTPRRALQAATLALADVADFPLSDHPHQACVVGRDAPGEAAHQHVLALADLDATLSALESAVRSAGWRADGCVPAEATMIAAVARAGVQASSSGPELFLYLGEHGSVLGAAWRGGLKFVRQVGLGTERLVEAMCSPAQDSQTRQAARRALFEEGIPVRQGVDLSEGSGGSGMLPRLAPVLQRLAMEIRQSLRFGFEERDRRDATLTVLGRGACVPHLAATLADLAQVRLARGPAGDATPGEGLVETWLRCGPAVALQANATRRLGEHRRVRRALVVGTSLAVLAVGWDALATRWDLTRTREELSRLQARLEIARPALGLRETSLAIQAGAAAAAQRASRRLGTVAPWDACLTLITRATPSGVRLHDITLTHEGETITARLSGSVRHTGTGEGNGGAAIRAYMDALAATPLVRQCRLAGTQRSGDGTVQVFDIALTLEGVRPRLHAEPRTRHATTEHDSRVSAAGQENGP